MGLSIKSWWLIWYSFVIFSFSNVQFVGASGKRKPPASAGDIRDAGLIPGSGRSPAGGHGNPLQYSCQENPHGQRSLVSYSP